MSIPCNIISNGSLALVIISLNHTQDFYGRCKLICLNRGNDICGFMTIADIKNAETHNDFSITQIPRSTNDWTLKISCNTGANTLAHQLNCSIIQAGHIKHI